jgi:multiple sugar transport system permease protein
MTMNVLNLRLNRALDTTADTAVDAAVDASLDTSSAPSGPRWAWLRSAGRWAGLSLYLLFALFPIYWLLKIALTPTRLLYSEGVPWWPSQLTFAHFSQVWAATQFADYFCNSVLVSLAAAGMATVLAALAGYALSRWQFRGKNVAIFFLLVAQMFSIMLMIVPLNRLLSGLGMADSLLGIALVYTAMNVPFASFLMQSFMDAIPPDLEDAAMVDGCTRLQSFYKVVLPLSLPGLAATAGFVFTAAWSELFLALILINRESSKTLAPALLSFITKFSVDWGQMAAASVLLLIPVCLFFSVIQRYLVAGLSSGAVKG